ncbi:unnamed protein product [Camellia sinensis]
MPLFLAFAGNRSTSSSSTIAIVKREDCKRNKHDYFLRMEDDEDGFVGCWPCWVSGSRSTAARHQQSSAWMITFAWAIVDIYFCVRRAFVFYMGYIYFSTTLYFGNPVFLYVIFNLDGLFGWCGFI